MFKAKNKKLVNTTSGFTLFPFRFESEICCFASKPNKRNKFRYFATKREEFRFRSHLVFVSIEIEIVHNSHRIFRRKATKQNVNQIRFRSNHFKRKYFPTNLKEPRKERKNCCDSPFNQCLSFSTLSDLAPRYIYHSPLSEIYINTYIRLH
jgi:hypothetical protein